MSHETLNGIGWCLSLALLCIGWRFFWGFGGKDD